MFFTFVGTFTFITYRLEEPPFSYSVAAASLVFLLWLTGLVGPLAGRIADRVGWRRLALGTVALSAAGVLLTLPDVLPLLVLGLACIAGAMFTGYTATQLGVSDVARVDRGAATALYFGIYYAGGALGAYLPGPRVAGVGVGWSRGDGARRARSRRRGNHERPRDRSTELDTRRESPRSRVLAPPGDHRPADTRVGAQTWVLPRRSTMPDVTSTTARSDDVLARIISTVASTLELDEVLRAVVRLLSDASGVHACFVYLVEGDQPRAAGCRRARTRA